MIGDVQFHCRRCGSFSAWSASPETLQALLDVSVPLAQLLRAVGSHRAGIPITISGLPADTDYPAPTEFLAQHAGHSLVLLDRYGHEGALIYPDGWETVDLDDDLYRAGDFVALGTSAEVWPSYWQVAEQPTYDEARATWVVPLLDHRGRRGTATADQLTLIYRIPRRLSRQQAGGTPAPRP